MVDRLLFHELTASDRVRLLPLIQQTEGLLFVGVHLLCFDLDGALEQAKFLQTSEGKALAKSQTYIDAGRELIESIERYRPALEALLQQNQFPLCFLFECEAYLERTLKELSSFAPDMVWVVILTEQGGVHLEHGVSCSSVAEFMHSCGVTDIAPVGTYINHLSPNEQDGCVLDILRTLVASSYFDVNNVKTNDKLFVHARVYE
jgi:hypothetical protein